MLERSIDDKNKFVREYRAESGYFNGPDGIAIGQILNREILRGKVCDLGCGPTLPLYAVSYFRANISEICGMDRLPECIDFIREQIRINLDDIVVQEAIKGRFKIDSEMAEDIKISEIYQSITELRVGSVLEKQLEWELQFDSVIQIGCFGALANQTEFNLAVNHAYSYLKDQGKFISATWVHDGTVERPHNFDSSFSNQFDRLSLTEGLEKSGFSSYKIIELPVLDAVSIKRGYQKILTAIAVR